MKKKNFVFDAEEVAQRSATIADFFQQMSACVEAGPDENRSLLILDGIYKISKELIDPVVTSNFELKWKDFHESIKSYCLPSDLEYYRIRIDFRVNKILDKQRSFG